MNACTPRRLAESTIYAALTCLAMGASRTVHAQAFVGGSIGGTHWSDSPCLFDGSCDKRRTAGTLRGGFQFSPYFGVEGRYFDLGRISSQRRDAVVITPPSDQVQIDSDEASVKGLGINAIATWPITEKVSISGIAGVARTEARQKSDSRLEPPGQLTIVDGSFETVRRTTNPYYGVAVGYSITSTLALSLEAERYRPDFGSAVPIDLVAVGLTYRFR
jgi:OmpA-OmpF porin, OOP family